jgi:hypothetical protein
MDIDVDVRVRVAFVTVYKFLHRATEVWEDGRLLSMESATDNDGKHHRLSVKRSSKLLAVDSDGKTWSLPGKAIPTSLWDRRVLSETSLLSGIDGTAKPTTVTRLGVELLVIDGVSTPCEATLIDAKPDFKRWVWYDPNGRLVKIRLLGSDDSEVVYNLEPRRE